MAVKGAVSIAKVKTPDLDGLISPCRGQDCVIVGGIEGKCWKLVPVEAEEKLEGVVKKYLDCAVKGGNKHHPLRRIHGIRISHCNYVIRHL